MGNFLTLVSIENTKLWKRLSTKIMLGILVVIIIAATSLIKAYDVSQKNNTQNTTSVSENWKADTQAKVEAEKASVKELESQNNKMQKTSIDSMKKTIAEDEYRINNNIKPEAQANIWIRSSSTVYVNLIILFLMITCAAVIAGEFSEGTMKMMITRPFSRNEILTAKLASVLLYGLLLHVIAFVLNFFMQGIFYGFSGIGATELLWAGTNIVVIPAALRAACIFGLDFLSIIVYALFAFALSAITRSRSIATGFSLFMCLAGSGILVILATLFDWGKFLPFVTVSFSTYVSNGVGISDTTLVFALIINLIYSIIFCAAGYLVFNKRDI
jgi:ABC-2 type transport system permease protein